jgi:hypothetical protein
MRRASARLWAGVSLSGLSAFDAEPEDIQAGQ